VIRAWVPWTRLGNLPWAELSASAFGRFETLGQLLGEAKRGGGKGCGRECWGKKGSGGDEEEQQAPVPNNYLTILLKME
jgi:hypothetical protein